MTASFAKLACRCRKWISSAFNRILLGDARKDPAELPHSRVTGGFGSRPA